MKEEVWKKIPFAMQYEVSNHGRVKSIPVQRKHNVSGIIYLSKEKLLKQNNNNSKKYWRVGLTIKGKQRWHAVHRLVALCFMPNPERLPQVNHKDGNRDNNHVDNLEWCTNHYNMQHAIKNGFRDNFYESLQGEKSHLNKYSEDTIRKIPDLINQGLSYSKVGKLLNIPPSLISEIKMGRAWSHLNIVIPDSKIYKKKR